MKNWELALCIFVAVLVLFGFAILLLTVITANDQNKGLASVTNDRPGALVEETAPPIRTGKTLIQVVPLSGNFTDRYIAADIEGQRRWLTLLADGSYWTTTPTTSFSYDAGQRMLFARQGMAIAQVGVSNDGLLRYGSTPLLLGISPNTQQLWLLDPSGNVIGAQKRFTEPPAGFYSPLNYPEQPTLEFNPVTLQLT